MDDIATAGIEIEVSNGQVRIIGENQLLKDGRYKILLKVVENVGFNLRVKKVEASKLSRKDEFMKHEPTTLEEQKVKRMIKKVIRKGIKDFWRPICDPSFNQSGTGICYEFGKFPAVGKSDKWWIKVAEEFKPEYKSRLGTLNEYYAFAGVVIKELVEKGLPISQAWKFVCNNSTAIGNYRNAINPVNMLENTGCRECCGWFDFANTYKIVTDNRPNGHIYLGSGCCDDLGTHSSLATIHSYDDFYVNRFLSVGWIIFEKYPIDD